MNRTITSVLALTITLAVSSPAFSAGYLKYDGVKGETKQKDSGTPSKVKGKEQDKARAKTKTPQESKGKKKGNVEMNWKVEEGRK
jgi:hypothetical protein